MSGGQRDRLVEVVDHQGDANSDPVQDITYTYDVFDRRVAETQITYTYDGGQQQQRDH